MADGINLGLTLCTDDAFLFVIEDGLPASSISVNGAKDGEMLGIFDEASLQLGTSLSLTWH